MYNRRWAIVAGLAVVELWIVGLILRSIAGGHGTDVAVSVPPMSVASAAPAGHGAERTIATGDAPRVVIDAQDAALSITARPGATVSVHERTHRSGWFPRAAHPVDVEQTADGVRISGESGDVSVLGGSATQQLDIVVPPQARLDVRNAGSTTVAGLRADAAFHSDDGPISVRDHRGAITVTTDNGRIELRDVDAPSVETRSDDGRVTFDNVRAERVAVTTDNGRIEISQSLLRGGRIQTDSGRVALGLDPQSDVTISAQTSSGKVVAALPLVMSTAGDDDDAPATIRVGNGVGRLDVGSGNGSISIRMGEPRS